MFRVVLIAVAFAAFPALAQQPSACVKRSDMLNHLSTNFDESPVAMGLTSSGKVIEVVASESGTWTIIVTLPDGISCGVASGMSWEKVGPTPIKGPKA